jgi:hypothetical protein
VTFTIDDESAVSDRHKAVAENQMLKQMVLSPKQKNCSKTAALSPSAHPLVSQPP